MKDASESPASQGRTPRSAKRAADLNCEVLIVGGGMVGLSLAIALAEAGVSVVVVDRENPATATATAFDGRSSAIARGSQQVLATTGVWPGLADHAEAIRDIRVTEGKASGGRASHLFLHFDASDIDGGPLGHIVENRFIRRAGLARAGELANLELLAPMSLAALRRLPTRVEAELDDGRCVYASLAVAADGRGSPLRAAAGIAVGTWDYGQDGIVCTVGHDKPHHGVAHEHFLPSGPFALLPMTDAAAGIHRSSLVWTEKRDLTSSIMALDDAAFGYELMRRFGMTLGALRVMGRRWSYPLSLLHAERYLDRRLVLIGDAAHGIHPIAGQGLNLGLRDVAALAEVLMDARRLGLDIGESTVLERYQRWRRFDNLALIAATDSLNRLFSNNIAPLRLARDLGIAAVDGVPPLKRFFMRHAMGMVGDLPRLIRGETL